MGATIRPPTASSGMAIPELAVVIIATGVHTRGASPALGRLADLIGRGLDQTAALWPDIAWSYRQVHQAAHILKNEAGEAASSVRRRFDGWLGAMARHRDRAGDLSGAVDHFRRVASSYRPGLFHCYAVPGLPRTNNDLEHEFGSQRYHERRASGRKTASPGTVARGEARLPAAIATRLRRPSGADLGRADRTRWRSLRHRLDRRRYSSVMRRRFRQNPGAYLADLEQKACQQTLPS